MSAEKKELIWTPDPLEGYVLGRVVDVGTDTLTVELEEQPGKYATAYYDDVYPATGEEAAAVEDNCSLVYLNEATLLQNIRRCYSEKKIYTYVGNILVAVNPYKLIPQLYSQEMAAKYKGKSLGVLPPHVFAIGDKVYRDMRRHQKSQSIIVSGESGAGKTETTKYILQYLMQSYGAAAGTIEQRILEANPLLEAFGNAQTLSNNNSSRFGKFVEIHFNAQFGVVGGHVSHYLLEKSRVCSQASNERNYHVFYQMLAGAPADMRNALNLSHALDYEYLHPSSRDAPVGKDSKEYRQLEHSMDCIGFSGQEKADIFRVVAAVLHLGNIKFEEETTDRKGGCVVSTKTEVSLMGVSNLLGVSSDDLRRCLISRIMTTTKRGLIGTVINVPLKRDQASNARDALAKAVYVRLFDWIVQRINKCFPFTSSNYYIGLLDIAGFEYYRFNSFEQFCINYCNEKLQQLFNERVLREEQELYSREGLGVATVMYVDNQDCIDVFEKKESGIIDLLDEECRLPRGSNENFTSAVHTRHKDHFRLLLPRQSKLSQHRSLRDEEGFIIRHFAGAVCYKTAGFLEKNNDSLHGSLEQLVATSQDSFVKGLFPSSVDQSSSGTFAKKLVLDSVGEKFRTQLQELMKKLRDTDTSFIRCIKPNLEMVPKKFVGGQVLSQLQCAGMIAVLKLMEGGYPSRTPFTDLYNTYKSMLPIQLARLHPRTFCETLFQAVGIKESEFKFGLNKVFFRAGKFAEFDQIMKHDKDNLAVMVMKVQKWLIRKQWRKFIYGAISVQKPNHLQVDKEKLEKHISEIVSATNSLIERIKCSKIPEAQIAEEYNKLSADAESLMSELLARLEQQKVEAEEREKMIQLHKVQEEERKRREAQIKHQKAERERKQLEEEARRSEDRQRKQILKAKMAEEKQLAADEMLSEQLEAEELKKQMAQLAIIEQERRDFELALRLAKDEVQSQGVISEQFKLRQKQHEKNQPCQATNAETRRFEQAIGKQIDLSKWKYAQLRDTINTSCDIKMLEACREELHRRLKVYHSWKDKKVEKRDGESRLPEGIGEAGPLTNGATSAEGQRYFRVPFLRPSPEDQNKKRGWWYAHFDGQWISRQLEIFPDTAPLLLVAGKDDFEMCELSLEETGLLRKKGAEISQEKFEEAWEKCNTKNYSSKL